MKMNHLYPIAKLGSHVLVIDERDLTFVGKNRALEVKCIKIDLEKRTIDAVVELERHLKFNPWEEVIAPEERGIILKILNTKFSDTEINEGIVRPLEQNKIK